MATVGFRTSLTSAPPRFCVYCPASCTASPLPPGEGPRRHHTGVPSGRQLTVKPSVADQSSRVRVKQPSGPPMVPIRVQARRPRRIRPPRRGLVRSSCARSPTGPTLRLPCCVFHLFRVQASPPARSQVSGPLRARGPPPRPPAPTVIRISVGHRTPSLKDYPGSHRGVGRPLRVSTSGVSPRELEVFSPTPRGPPVPAPPPFRLCSRVQALPGRGIIFRCAMVAEPSRGGGILFMGS